MNPEQDTGGVVTEDHLTWLDELRESGITNMFGATPYIQEAFGVDRNTARVILQYWMKTFEKRHHAV